MGQGGGKPSEKEKGGKKKRIRKRKTVLSIERDSQSSTSRGGSLEKGKKKDINKENLRHVKQTEIVACSNLNAIEGGEKSPPHHQRAQNSGLLPARYGEPYSRQTEKRAKLRKKKTPCDPRQPVKEEEKRYFSDDRRERKKERAARGTEKRGSRGEGDGGERREEKRSLLVAEEGENAHVNFIRITGGKRRKRIGKRNLSLP